MRKLSENIVRTNDVIGKKIHSLNGENLGKVEELILDKITGQVRYAVLANGGFMGIGSAFYAIPWHSLEYCIEHDAFQVNFSKDDLKTAPGFNKDSWPDFTDPLWDKSTNEFYNYLIIPKSQMPKEQTDFISEGGNSQPLNKDIQS